MEVHDLSTNWRNLPSPYDRYSANDLGEIKRRCGYIAVHNVWRNGARRDELWFRSSRVLKRVYKHGSVPYVYLYTSHGSKKLVAVKRIIAELFIGASESTPTKNIRHKDGNPENCRADNLVVFEGP